MIVQQNLFGKRSHKLELVSHPLSAEGVSFNHDQVVWVLKLKAALINMSILMMSHYVPSFQMQHAGVFGDKALINQLHTSTYLAPHSRQSKLLASEQWRI